VAIGYDAVAEDTERLGGVETASSHLADEMGHMRQELARVRAEDRRT
jgi:hypothetical protein